MLRADELDFGFRDAQNYKTRDQKQKFNQWFIKNDALDRICLPQISFLVGEKGTGKTAYSVYLANNEYKNISADVKYVKETDYLQFISLKREHHLSLSNYTVIWKVLLFMLLSEKIIKSENNFLADLFNKFSALKNAMDEYYSNAFSPEVTEAFEFIADSKTAVELISKYVKVNASEGEQVKVNSSRFQTNLLYIKRNFEEAFKQLKLKKNHLIFIDGIDFRPTGVQYSDYLDCIKGLANAIWDLNTDFFPSIKDSIGRCRIVLLTRPDIFNSISLQNQNAKLQDNSVLLNWITDYKYHRNSDIFNVTERILSSQNTETLNGKFWDYYFPWNAPNNQQEFDHPSSFLAFLRWSYHKPRDIITMLDLLKNAIKKSETFSLDHFEQHNFKRAYANYLLGEIKDQLSFYYESDEYEAFLKFFEFLNGKNKFDYPTFCIAFEETVNYLRSINQNLPKFMSTSNEFLQFLYQLNIICYLEKPIGDENRQPVAHWCFRERNSANISPKVKIGASSYEVFYGLRKALNVEIQVK
ncbi:MULTISPECIES: P-loop ATPase, Sll1717 family [Acinetobacter]|jgi:hypothetical protein|uniref:P-loop ATPase, Sll1717 family n=1 Tax=Acinetobacter TaxID=469 RepID=UPI00124FF208|nr:MULTISPECIES: funZ protein [Acinetobacter]MCH7306448.1 hypothetical protein [Acinetobacter higginsii]